MSIHPPSKVNCNSPGKTCCVGPDCLPPLVHGEARIPCGLRQMLQREAKRVNAMPNGPMKERETVTLDKRRKGMTEVWEPICGLQNGGRSKRKSLKSRRKSGGNRKSRRSRR